MKELAFLIAMSMTASLFAQFPLPSDRSAIFSGSGLCQDCHQGNDVALTYQDVDISPISYWRSTMMANAGKDPLWQAKVSAESVENAVYQAAIENKCTTCHAPVAQTTADWMGQTPYVLDSLTQTQNWLGRDGVNCTVCHQIQSNNFGLYESYSGNFHIDDSQIIWGPYETPSGATMTQRTGYEPDYGAWLDRSEHCATCHTLFTAYVDTTGQLTGAFPEQTPYLEWKNSRYSQEDRACQDCHMPQIEDPLVIATRPVMGLPQRSPFFKHAFVGGNQLVPSLLKDHQFEFKVTAATDYFDSTLARANRQLVNKSIALTVDTSIEADSVRLDVTLANLSGHKLPTGIPIRRMWLHVRLSSGDKILFESGGWDDAGEIVGLNETYEPHYQWIRQEDQVQIYEGVMKNARGVVTHTLLEAADYMKDNRIPPAGFTQSHDSYDTTAIVGQALFDSDFNQNDNIRGSGRDVVHYGMPAASGSECEVLVQVCYQSVTPHFLTDLYQYATDEVRAFESVITPEQMAPVIVKDTTFGITIPVSNVASSSAILPDTPELYANYPNPFNSSTQIAFALPFAMQASIDILTVQGQLVWHYRQSLDAGLHTVQWQGRDSQGLAVPTGIYICRLKAGNTWQHRRLVLIK